MQGYADEAKDLAIKYFNPIDSKKRQISLHWCVIVYNNKIIGSGVNVMMAKHGRYSTHAEISAINSARNYFSKHKLTDKKFKHCSLVVIRISPKDHLFRMSSPCDDCRKKITSYKINNIYYSTDDSDILTKINFVTLKVPKCKKCNSKVKKGLRCPVCQSKVNKVPKCIREGPNTIQYEERHYKHLEKENALQSYHFRSKAPKQRILRVYTALAA